MFCPKCGNEISNQAKFCSKCGAAISNEPAGPAPEHQASGKSARKRGGKPEKKEKKPKRRGKKILIAAAVALAALILLPALFSSSEPEPSDQSETDEFIMEDRLSRLGVARGEVEAITDEEADTLMEAVASMEKAFAVGADGSDPLIEEHDWSVYSSDLGREHLSNAELELYDRFDRVAMQYLTQSNLDGERSGRTYKISGVQYSDLGLSLEQAFDLLLWFEYNNPQYYFLGNFGSGSSDLIFPGIYDFMADGEKRAEITNELFTKLESWVQTVGSSAANTYQKEVCASNLICQSVTYDHDALLPENSKTMDLCQSLYSVVIRENTVCAGYSKAFCAIMSALGVDATAGLSASHAWNVVRFDDGNYYCVDVCWNDTDDDPPYRNDYINVGDKDSKAGDNGRECHIYEDCYARWIPKLAEGSYQPTSEDTRAVVQQPAAPQNFKVTENADALNFTWDAAPDASGYVIVKFDDPDYAGTPSWSAPVSGTGYTYRKTQRFETHSIKPGTTYYFGVRAYTGDDESGKVYSDWTCLTMTTAGEQAPEPAVTQLAAPANLRGEYTNVDTAKVYWDTASDVTRTELIIYKDAEHTNRIQNLTVRPGNYLQVNRLKEGYIVYLSLRAVKEENGQTIYSDWVDFEYTHDASAAPPPVKDLDVPASARVEYYNADSARVSWSSGDTGILGRYTTPSGVVELCQYTDSTYTEIVEGSLYSASGSPHYMEGLEVGRTYYIGVRRRDGASCSDWVNFTYTHSFTAPDAPRDIRVKQAYTSHARIVWNGWPATEFEVNVYPDESRSGKPQTSRVSRNDFDLTGLKAGETYYLSIRGISISRDDGHELYSDWADFTYTHTERR